VYLIKTPHITDPKLNLAIEEFAVRSLDISKEYLFIYSNAPSIIIGKNQNPFQEINWTFLENNEIEVIRRISGGGAVYHEAGNINFSFITQSSKENFNKYTRFLEPIVNTLNSLNANTRINKRNDLVIGNKKISGNAQFTSRNRLLSHGTLLYNADLATISKALNSPFNSIISKSTKSVHSKVTNIYDYLKKKIDIESFKNILTKALLDAFSFDGYLEFDQVQWNEIKSLAAEKYSSWDWNWGRTPKFKFLIESNNPIFKSSLDISAGRIKKIEFQSGDRQLKNCFDGLIGCRFSRESIKKYFDDEIKCSNLIKNTNLLETVFPF
jgi:lipoate---protein ligase